MNLTEKIFGQKDLSQLTFPVGEKVKQKFEEYWNIEEEFEEIKREIRKKVMMALVKRFQNEGYAVLYEEEFLTGKASQPLLIARNKYIENLAVGYAIESDEPDFFKLRYGIRADYCDERNPKEKIIYLSRDPEYQKEILKQYYYESVDKCIDEIKSTARKIYKKWDEKPCWLITGFFESYYGDTGQKEFYLEVLEKGYEKVADYYFNKIEDLIRETENPLMVLNEIED